MDLQPPNVDLDALSVEVAERCVESAYRNALESMTVAERTQLRALGFSDQELMTKSLEPIHALRSCREAIETVAADITNVDDPLVVVLPKIATRHLLDQAMFDYLHEQIAV